MKNSFTNYILLDQKIEELTSTSNLNVLYYLYPQNLLKEKQTFFEEFKNKNVYNPKFIYPSKNPFFSYFSMNPDFDVYKKELRDSLKDVRLDSMGLLFENKILDTIEKMELIKSIGTPNFSENSKEFFGGVDKKLLNLAKEIVEKNVRSKDNQKVSFNTAIKTIKNFLEKNKLKYSIEIRESSGSNFSVMPAAKKIFINKNLQFTTGMIKRFIGHEIEAHLYRYENGSLQPYLIFAKGVSKNTIQTEEGLAVNLEIIKNLDFKQQLKNYAGRVLAVDLASKKSFYDTFEELTKFFSFDEAFMLTFRSKRGTFKTSEPGAFTKDILYFKGKFLVEDFLKENSISDLYYGKYGVDDVFLVKDVEGLKKPKLLPDIPKEYFK